VVGVVVQLGQCFDLMDTLYTRAVAAAYLRWRTQRLADGQPLPVNAGPAPDHKDPRKNNYAERERPDASSAASTTCASC